MAASPRPFWVSPAIQQLLKYDSTIVQTIASTTIDKRLLQFWGEQAMIRSICNAFAFGIWILAGTAAAAEEAAKSDTGSLQEVLVTARRFTEDLQSVPIAVTAIGAAAIETQD